MGGSNILPMKELRELAEDVGFAAVQTYIQSGNVIFESLLSEKEVTDVLTTALQEKMGNPIPVMMRTKSELTAVLNANPFADEDPKKVGVMFFAEKVEDDFLEGVSTTTGEVVEIGAREVYIDYPNGMGRSKLKLPKQADGGTTRNINTVQKILDRC